MSSLCQVSEQCYLSSNISQGKTEKDVSYMRMHAPVPHIDEVISHHFQHMNKLLQLIPLHTQSHKHTHTQTHTHSHKHTHSHTHTMRVTSAETDSLPCHSCSQREATQMNWGIGQILITLCTGKKLFFLDLWPSHILCLQIWQDNYTNKGKLFCHGFLKCESEETIEKPYCKNVTASKMVLKGAVGEDSSCPHSVKSI